MTEPMHLYAAVRPDLTAGRYELKTSQTISGGGLGTRTVDSRTQHIDVTAPRTTMAPDEVFSVVPPPHAQGPFEGRLPHITLKRRTLPWDRSDPEKTGPPWLALVMLAEGEGTFRRGERAADCYSDGIAATLDPPLEADVRGDCIEVTRTIVDRTFPAADEIGLLCHAREADASDTELADDDHWVSVVLCNRLPLAGTAYRCMLISLEGQHDVLPPTGGAVEAPSRVFGWDDIFLVEDIPLIARVMGDGFSIVPASVNSTRIDATSARVDTSVANATARSDRNRTVNRTSDSVSIGAQGGFVRLDADTPAIVGALLDLGRIEETFRFPVLATWEFECSDVPGDFGGLMARLDVALLGDEGNQAADPRRVLPTTTVTGHLAIEHTDRLGDTGTAWYRSPCSPVKVTREPAGAPFHVADQARRIGSEGREDLSLVSAFEVGRLLAMSDPQFLASLRRWARNEFAFHRDRSLLDGIIELAPSLLDNRLVDLGRLLAVETLGRGGIGGPPIDLLGQPLLVHPDGGLTQPDDIQVLARGFGVTEVTVKQLAGDGISDRPIDTGPATGGGRIDIGDAVDVIGGLRVSLDTQVVERLDRVVDLERRLSDTNLDRGRLDDVFGGRP